MNTNNKYEIWKQIDGYANYMISNFGNVISIANVSIKRNSKIKGIVFKKLKITVDSSGYTRVSLYKNGTPKSYKVHRLVAEAFIPNRKNLPQINHKDENKQNNKVSNLEWCNSSYNNNYGTRNDKVRKKVSMEIACYDLKGNFIKKYKSMQETKKDGFSPSKVCQVCKQSYGRKTHKGFIFKKILDNL